MSNFNRALRFAFQHRWNLAAALLSSLAVAVLWGGNLTAVFPVVDVIMTDRSLPQWIDAEAARSRRELGEYRERERDLQASQLNADDNQEIRGSDQKKLKAELAEVRSKIRLHEKRAEWFTKVSPLAHRWLPDTPFETLVVVCALVVVGTVVKCILRVINTLLVARLGCAVGFHLRKEFYQQTLRLDMKNFSEQGRGDLMNRCTSDLNRVSSGVQILFGQAILEPLKFIVCISIAAWVSWRLLLLTLIVAPLAGYLVAWLAKSLKRAHRKAMQELSSIYETLTETLSTIKLIKAYTMETAEQDRFKTSSQQYYNRQLKIAGYDSLISPMTEFLGVMMIILASICGGYLVLRQQTHIFELKISEIPLTHGMMSIFFAMMAGMSDPARRLAGLFNHLQQAFASADRVYEVLDREPGIKSPANPKVLPTWSEGIEFKNVSFRYDPQKPVLTDINLKIASKETVAIVGPNGCGKSTLLHLLPRFYDPTQGSTLVGGVDIRDVRVHDLRSRIGLVSQETLLLNDTVAHNIAYGAPEATQEQIEQAARKAHAHEFIVGKLTEGYRTIVGPGGSRLSGGQRQRISLARAILRNPELLILDEATSQIDLESERLIHQVMQEFQRDRTTLMITHRTSNIALADRVVVMDSGTIADVGTHDQLLGRCDLYRRLSQQGDRLAA